MFNLYGVHLGGSLWIDEIQNQNYDPGLQQLLAAGDGNIDPTHVSVMGQRPIFGFTTWALARALALCGNAGRVIVDTGDPIDFYYRKRAAGATYAGGADHLRIRVPKGLLYLNSLAAAQGDPATAQFTMAAVKGTGPIIIIDKNTTPPAMGSLAPEVFTLGPWWVNGVKVDPVQSFNLNTGIELGFKSGNGELSPTMAFFKTRNLSMECSTSDMDWLDETAALGGLGVARSGITRAFLTKKVKGAANLADGTAEHVRLELAEGRILPGTAGGEHAEDSALQIQVSASNDGTNDGTNDPLAISTSAVIAGT